MAFVTGLTMTRQPFWTAVRHLLIERHIRQQDLAAELGCSRFVLSQWICGHRVLSRDELFALVERTADVLDVEPDYFIEYRVMLVVQWLEQHPGEDEAVYRQLEKAA